MTPHVPPTRKVHLAWDADVLCGQRYPKPRRTAAGRGVTCVSCHHVAATKLRTTHRDETPPPEWVPTHWEAIRIVAGDSDD